MSAFETVPCPDHGERRAVVDAHGYRTCCWRWYRDWLLSVLRYPHRRRLPG